MWFEARASINSGSQIEFDGRDLQNIYILGPKGIKLKDDQVIFVFASSLRRSLTPL